MSKKKEVRPLRVVELFAGVGGFRIGLEGHGRKRHEGYKVVWSNQWEPATKKQHASNVYATRFGSEGHSNEDIAKVSVKEIPDHDLLVGGFPCQDYSVARNLIDSAGLQGKKGVLWWQIHRLLHEKKNRRPKYLILENVDRLLKTPVSQRGRDFAVMLRTLNDLGYIVEWRIINAADYGMPQRRRRIFIMGYKKGTRPYNAIKKLKDPIEWITEKGIISKAFPVEHTHVPADFTLHKDPTVISAEFNLKNPQKSPFENAGVSIDGNVYTKRVTARYNGKRTLLGDVLLDESEVPEEFFIHKEDLKFWKYLKGAKKEPRKSRNKQHTFVYAEGPMIFPDPLDRPSRTIITGEGGPTPSRFKHVIRTKSGRLRRLTPIELERLCMFPDNHTAGETNSRRAFFVGNSLVVGVVEKLGKELLKWTKN